jgi:hypothetical protein
MFLSLCALIKKVLVSPYILHKAQGDIAVAVFIAVYMMAAKFMACNFLGCYVLFPVCCVLSRVCIYLLNRFSAVCMASMRDMKYLS